MQQRLKQAGIKWTISEATAIIKLRVSHFGSAIATHKINISEYKS